LESWHEGLLAESGGAGATLQTKSALAVASPAHGLSILHHAHSVKSVTRCWISRPYTVSFAIDQRHVVDECVTIRVRNERERALHRQIRTVYFGNTDRLL
jgi:Leu/Phe-tRNA-protein transferase